ncbi:MAG: TlpA family protein disulfide reductase [Firmicutes bacterium]|nr:TlpA family protein disulfide reductase [Bacillota bacterium]
MMNKMRFIIGALAFVCLLGGAYILYTQFSGDHLPAIDYTEEQGETAAENTVAAPDFTVENENGELVMLSDLIGRPVVLNLWASWCPPCKSEMPDFEEAYQTYGNDVEFMMVNLTDGSRETVETAKAFIAEQNFTFPVYFDTANEAAIAYQASSIPATYFIDKNGNIIAHAVGMLDKANILKGIEMILE